MNFKKSCPENVLLYRPPDSAQGFDIGKSSKLRFSSHSPCDYFMYNGELLFVLELKSVKGTSISFEREKTDKGIIHYYQIASLKNFSHYKNVVSGIVIDFRGSDNTYFLRINEWDNLINSIDKKNFNEKDLHQYCSPILIEKKKLRVNYKYDICKFIEDVNKFLEVK